MCVCVCVGGSWDLLWSWGLVMRESAPVDDLRVLRFSSALAVERSGWIQCNG